MAEKNLIPVSVSNRYVSVGDHTPVVAGNVGVDFIVLTLDSEWSTVGGNIYVTFLGCGEEPTTVDLPESMEVGVPWEQVTEECELYVGVQALSTDGTTIVLNTRSMRMPIQVRESSATDGMEPQQPTASTLQRVEEDIVRLEGLIGDVDQVVGGAESATAAANAAAASANASKEAAQQAASDANSAAKAATAAAAKADTAAGNADKATAAASSAADAANAATSDAITAEEQRKQTFIEQLEDWQRQVDVSAVASLMASVSFGLSDDGDQIAYLPVNPGYAFRLNENNDLEVVA